MPTHPLYQPSYAKSRALVVGINSYQRAAPLAHARNDAEAIASALEQRFGFLKADITLLVDGAASAEAIRAAFLEFTNSDADDRVIFFFAGHGHTVPGYRGETGFLVPADGRVDELSTLIRWDELTRNAELIPAKHILFLMDACYGGLALSRAPVQSGSMRFLRDMLQRYSRQVLTAGKANEVVSDAGGRRAGHSIFTANVLDALEGAAAGQTGVITANSLMGYVYEKVSNDPNSRQTPHYGFIDGDGDFIFDTTRIAELGGEPREGKDLLFEISSSAPSVATGTDAVSKVVKEWITDARYQIQLDDFVSSHVRQAIEALKPDKFPSQDAVTKDEFGKRIRRYEDAVADLRTIVILLSRWGTPRQLPLIEKIFLRLAEAERSDSGLVVWLGLTWYPIALLMYVAGIAALSVRNFDVLKKIFLSRVRARMTGVPDSSVIVQVTDGMDRATDGFKLLPGHERHYVPESEYLFTLIQPELEDALFLGRSYETFFDEFEIMWALLHANIQHEAGLNPWGPPGRFAWKHRRGRGESPYEHFVQEAQLQGDNWAALKAGLFNGSAQQFSEVATEFRKFLDRWGFR